MKRIVKLFKSEIARVIIGAVLFVLALILEQTLFKYASLPFYILALAIVGGEVFVGAVKGILRRDLLDEKFLMSIASIGAMIVDEWSEGVAVMLFFLVGQIFEHRAVRKSRASIRSLMDICPDEACLVTDDGEDVVDAEDVAVGSTILIRPGERVPIDSVVIRGNADVDTSSMTGESLPIAVSEGAHLSSGYIVQNGLIYAKTVRTSDESAAARVLELVENANEKKSKEESFITKFSRVYTPVVVICAILVAVIPPIFGLRAWVDSIYTALTFLVISCPCALVISVPMAFFGGIGGAASRGILFKGGNIFSSVAKVETVAFDKTGTLTNGRFEISSIDPINISKQRLLILAASVESASNHPIAECISSASAEREAVISAEEFPGRGIIATLESGKCAVGNYLLMRMCCGDDVEAVNAPGRVYISLDGRLVGSITLSDKIKEEANDAVAKLKRLGVKRSVILSGDAYPNVKRVSQAVGIETAFAEQNPSDKYDKIDKLSTESVTMYVGDGINDAPSLARAHVGVAMGSLGQDSAIESADVVIMTDNLMKLPEAVLIARKTINISWQNIIFAIGIKLLILILGLFGFANMWLAVFADVGVAVIAILNSMRALRAPKV